MLLAFAVGALLGSGAMIAFTLAYHWLFFRAALADGQYALAILVCVPLGVVLGALSGLIIRLCWGGKGFIAGWCGTIASLVLISGCWSLAWNVLSGTEHPSIWERLGSVMFWCGVPILWAAAVLLISVVLIAAKQPG